jgi:hypothetical protein
LVSSSSESERRQIIWQPDLSRLSFRNQLLSVTTVLLNLNQQKVSIAMMAEAQQPERSSLDSLSAAPTSPNLTLEDDGAFDSPPSSIVNISAPYQERPAVDNGTMEPVSSDQVPNIFSIVGTWSTEIALLVVSIAALIAIWLVLGQFSNRSFPAWKYNINLNTIIAILSTILRTSLLSVLESCK